MKKTLVIILTLLLWVGLAYGKANSPKKHVKTSNKDSTKVQAATKDVSPYKAYVVVEASSGKVIEGENTNVKRPPASVIKLMVACIVLDKIAKGELKLTDKITVSAEASRIGGSQVYLKEGESFTLEELIKATLVASGNDSAYAIAEHIAGSKEGFIVLMNEKAKALGMIDTHFNSVHGLPPSKGEEGDLTTCADLALLAKELLKHPKTLEWTSIKSEGFRDGTFIMNNHNKLLMKMPGIVDGMKTGYFNDAGFNLVATGKKNDLRFIVVVLGSPTAKIRDMVAMEKFKKAFAYYQTINIVKKGDLIDKDIFLVDGKKRKIKGVVKETLSCSIPNDKKENVKKEIVLPDKIQGEIKEGQKLGEIIVKLDNETIGKVDIVSPANIPKANLFTRLIRKLGFNI